ncbi:pilus assembly PilX family protein [Endozoicomonas atrinae]|nr:pilus assembly PilX N-terminal domain-containing protein [Endozoicomonas atrinae]
MKQFKSKQSGMILMVSLLFLMMLTTIAVTLVNQSSRSPRMIANAEIKLITFNQAQATLNQIAVMDMSEFDRGVCGAEHAPYNPIDPDSSLTQAQQTAHTCGANNAAPSPSIHYQASSQTVPRSEDASGVGKYSVEFYQIQTDSAQSGITTSLAMNTYKVMLGEQGGSAHGDQNVVIGSTPLSASP